MNIGGDRNETRDPKAPVLFYDGLCGFCNGIVRFVLDHDRLRTLRFATLQGPTGTALIERHPQLREIDSVVWLEPVSVHERERVYVRADAALRAASYLGGFWRFAVLAYVIPKPVRDAVYDFIARHRHRLTRGPAYCRFPDGEDHTQFLD